MSVQNSMFIGDLFLIGVSDEFLHPVGGRQRVKLYPARVFTGTRVFRSLHAFRVHKDHCNDSMFIGDLCFLEVSDELLHP